MLLRILRLAVMVLGLVSGAAMAQTDSEAVSNALALPELFDIMREEGIAYGNDLEEDLFTGGGGPRWRAEVAEIYDSEKVYQAFFKRFATELPQDGVSSMLNYLTGPEGARIVQLEVDARRAFLDDTVRDAAEARVEEMAAADDKRLAQIQRFITSADLLEGNIANALNGSLAFYRGLAAGGALPERLDEGELLGQVWTQEPDIREETETWLLSYLATAYAPLSDEELDRYINFYETDAGQDLNRALFAAFDDVFTQISYQLGLAAARQLVGQDL
ncbi:hypothetical protein OEW28_14890 [Defluviimonas sp. WL0002]|uniref:DUF2059 domain-containing protein n=1 Tax=Albidovulum marisflavi TaxID=2984159 RepID=A0ABT2ZFK5_9RHOB|nr:hypothetical protein [Defluviimonas sp. WL0002]MCV2869915.1 hypothetical protein [Defluviimonas sp. WL0002]